MAEYLARERFHLKAESAGVTPGSISDIDNAVYTLKQHGIDASKHSPRDVKTLDICAYDLIVTMDNHVKSELLQLFPKTPLDRLEKWGINDPYGDDLTEYERCAGKIHKQLKLMSEKWVKK